MLDPKSVYGKLSSAEEHFKLVDAEISAWMKGCTYSFAFRHNADFTRHAVVLSRTDPEPDLLRWTLILGDCINNLRSSLDHLIYAVAKHETRNDPTCDIEKLAFIIVDKPELFMNKDNRKRLEGLSQEVIDAVRSCQPFIRRHPVLPPALAILRNFSNDDKHRLLRTANSAPTILDLEFTSPRLREDKRIIPVSEPIGNNAEICVVESPSQLTGAYYELPGCWLVVLLRRTHSFARQMKCQPRFDHAMLAASQRRPTGVVLRKHPQHRRSNIHFPDHQYSGSGIPGSISSG
jgi:hypothetical protein